MKITSEILKPIAKSIIEIMKLYESAGFSGEVSVAIILDHILALKMSADQARLNRLA